MRPATILIKAPRFLCGRGGIPSGLPTRVDQYFWKADCPVLTYPALSRRFLEVILCRLVSRYSTLPLFHLPLVRPFDRHIDTPSFPASWPSSPLPHSYYCPHCTNNPTSSCNLGKSIPLSRVLAPRGCVTGGRSYFVTRGAEPRRLDASITIIKPLPLSQQTEQDGVPSQVSKHAPRELEFALRHRLRRHVYRQ